MTSWVFDFSTFQLQHFWLLDFLTFQFSELWTTTFVYFWLSDFPTYRLFNFSTFQFLDFSTFWLFRFVSFWLFKFLTFWLFKFLTSWLFEFSSSWLLDFSAFWLFDFAILDFAIWVVTLSYWRCISRMCLCFIQKRSRHEMHVALIRLIVFQYDKGAVIWEPDITYTYTCQNATLFTKFVTMFTIMCPATSLSR